MADINRLLPKNATNKQRNDFLKFLGWKPYRWQEVEMNKMRRAALKGAGRYGLVVARQNGKSYDEMWLAIELAVVDGKSGAIDVHNDKLKKKLLREMISFVSKLQEAGLIKKILQGDDSMIEFTNGAVIYVVIRNEGYITGLSLDFLLHDEAQKMDDGLESEAKPVLKKSEMAFTAYIGTPQTEADHKKYGINLFTRLLESQDPCMSLYCAYDDYNEDLEFNWKVLAKANPSWRETPNYKKKIQELWETESKERFWNFYGAVPYRRADQGERKPPRFELQEVESFLTKKGSIANSFVLSIGITAESDTAYAAMNDGLSTEVGHRWEIPYGELHQIAEDIKNQARSFTQIRISGTPRGKALADMLKERHLGPKIKVMGMPETSSNISLLISQLSEGKLKVWENDPKLETKEALSSFWLEVNPRSGGATPVSTMKTHEAIVIALANSSLDEKTTERMRAKQRYAPRTEVSEVKQNRPQRRYSW